MSAPLQNPALSKPRWDGSRVLFEIEVGGQPVMCAISRGALQELSGRRHFASTDLLRCFLEARPRIEELAVGKINGRPDSVSGIVSIWADDMDSPPAAPATGQQRERNSSLG